MGPHSTQPHGWEDEILEHAQPVVGGVTMTVALSAQRGCVCTHVKHPTQPGGCVDGEYPAQPGGCADGDHAQPVGGVTMTVARSLRQVTIEEELEKVIQKVQLETHYRSV